MERASCGGAVAVADGCRTSLGRPWGPGVDGRGWRGVAPLLVLEAMVVAVWVRERVLVLVVSEEMEEARLNDTCVKREVGWRWRAE